MTNQTPRKRRTRRPSFIKLLKDHSPIILEQYCAEHDVATRMELANKAQQIILSSHECVDDLDQIQMCLQALEIYPLAADALTIIATIGDYYDVEVRDLLRLATKVAKLDCVEYLANDVGFFWGILETRPYMRAHFNLAEVLLDLEKVDEAIDIYKHLLLLDMHDNLGARFELLPLLHQKGLREEAEDIMVKFDMPLEEYDSYAFVGNDIKQMILSMDTQPSEEWYFWNDAAVLNQKQISDYMAIEATLLKYSDGQTGILSVSGLDGLFAAVVSHPSMLLPDQWMPLIFGDVGLPEWDDPNEYMEFFGRITPILSRVADVFYDDASTYRPLLRLNSALQNPIAQSLNDWCRGYLKIAAQWEADYSDENLTEVLFDMRQYTDDQSFWSLTQMDENEQDEAYMMLSIGCIANYWHFKPEQWENFASKIQPAMPMRNEVVAGRNDPCPCGSGKKYKKCCLH